jgi:hypothetical protein
VKRPSKRSAPPNISRQAPSPIWDIRGTVPPDGIMAGKAKSFVVPAVMNMNAATMRSRL